ALARLPEGAGEPGQAGRRHRAGAHLVGRLHVGERQPAARPDDHLGPRQAPVRGGRRGDQAPETAVPGPVEAPGRYGVRGRAVWVAKRALRNSWGFASIPRWPVTPTREGRSTRWTARDSAPR